MAFFCISCKSPIEPRFKACPFCGEPVTDFLRKYLEEPIDGKYQILSRLGIGGMGEVYKVMHIHLNAIRVIKLMRPSIMSEEGSHERFVREARLATRIQHPSVAALYDFSTLDDGSYYMVWEFIEGTNLTELMRAKGPLSPRYAARISQQALLGLDAVHRVGIVHRDISPENMMITRDSEGEERVKIIDLGIAKQWADAADDKTKTGMFVGKWKYCSPEHLGMLKEGERIDGRADLYSFGIVLYEMLTGVAPFVADSPHRYLLLHATETPKPLSEANPTIRSSPELEALIFKALEKDRAGRFSTAREWAKALEALIPSLPDEAAAAVATDVREAKTEEHRGAPAPAVVATQVRPPEAQQATRREMAPDRGALSYAATQVTRIGSPEWDEVPAGTLISPARATLMQTQMDVERVEEPVPARRRPILWLSGLVLMIAVVAGGVYIFGKSQTPADVPVSKVVASTVSQVPRARLGLNAFPWGEVINIKNLENGQSIELSERMVTPASIDLPPGRYEVVMMNPKYPKPVSEAVELTAGQQQILNIEFTDPEQSQYPDFRGRF